MKKRMAKLISITLIGAMMVSLAACGKNDSNEGKASAEAAEQNTTQSAAAESSETEDISVGIVVKTATNAHFQDIAYGAMLAGKDLGITVKVDNTSTEADVEGQITKCENMISVGVDALILTANDSDGVGAAVEAAHDAGIPFITVDTEITNEWDDDEKEYMPCYIGVDHTQMAYELAKNVFDKLGGEGNVVVLRGNDAASSSQERTAGFEKAISEYESKGIKMIQSQSANYDQDEAATTMADIIQANKDIDAVLCCNDLMAVGAVTALEENNITVGGEDGVLVAGIDGNVIALESIEEGKIYGSAYDWSILQGYYAVEQAYNLIQGKEAEELINTPDTIITGENVADYLPHGQELANWQMGSELTDVSDYMRDFIEKGEGL